MKCGWLSAPALLVSASLLVHGLALAADTPRSPQVTLQSERVPAKFRGVSLGQFIAALEKRTPPPKGEFETSEAYQQRVARASAGPILAGVTADDTLVFVVTPSSSEYAESGVMYSYDADGGGARVYLRPGKSGSFSLSDDPAGYTRLTLDERKASSDRYVGSNAFGATLRVDRHYYYGFGLAIPGDIPRQDLNFQLPPKEAAREMPVMKVAVFVKLKDMNVAREEVRDAPTRDIPTDIITRSKYLKVDLLGYIAFSGIDGRVFGSTNR